MGRISRNQGADDQTLNLLEGLVAPPVNEDGVVEIAGSFRSNKLDGYPVWSENKSKLIAQYVYHFIMVTKHGAYIDGFAGPQVEEYNDESWSAKRVLEIQPPWISKFFLCDMNGQQVERLQQLKTERVAAGDKRKIKIFHGDFNVEVNKVLAEGNISEKVATFCLLDQRTFECKWSTVKKLAQHKSGSKIELFYFVAVGWLARSMTAVKDRQKLVDWWGRDDVDVLKGARGVDIAAMFARRFGEELGYQSALPWPIYERANGGKVMYYMIHATDHPEAPKLMNRAYYKSTLAFEPMAHLQAVLEGFDLGGERGSSGG